MDVLGLDKERFVVVDDVTTNPIWPPWPPSWISFSSISRKMLRWIELIFGGSVGLGQRKVLVGR